ncbi:MAG: ABC transporter permease [Saprospiraceae bacterium]
MFSNKEKQFIKATEEGRLEQTPFSLLKRRFRRNRTALWSLRVLYGLVFMAVFGDFIANEKPVFCKIDGTVYFPVLKQYAVNLGLAQWPAEFYQNEWSSHRYNAVLFPPIPYSAGTIDPKNTGYKSPFAKQNIPSNRYRHWLGTDNIGHDIAAGLVAGTRTALLVGLIAMAIATLIGVVLGSLAGYFGDDRLRVSRSRFWLNVLALFFGWFYGLQARGHELSEAAKNGGLGWELLKSLSIVVVCLLLANALAGLLGRLPVLNKKMTLPLDLLVMRSIEVLNSIPGLLLLLAIVAVLQKSTIFHIMAIIGLVRWTGIARFQRAELMRIRHLNYIEAARAMGFSDWRILIRHALPNAITPVLITIAFGIASAILLESALSFLGFGGEGVTWGKMLAEARRYPGAWWLAVFPGGAIFVTVTVFNLIGEGLSEAMAGEG